ncbi:MAG: glycosyltransferase [Candidatus Magasanikbacteria bacterium]
MKIILVNKYWYIRGGAERVVFLTKQLLEQAGHIVEIFGMRHPQNILENDYFVDYIDYDHVRGFGKVKAGLKAIYNFDAKEKFARLVDDFKPDVVHFHNIYHQLSFSLLDVVKEKHIPAVMTMHDYNMFGPNYRLFHHGKVQDECMDGNMYHCVLDNCMEHILQSIIATIAGYIGKQRNSQSYIRTYISPSEFVKQKAIAYGFAREHIRAIPTPLDVHEYPICKKDGDVVVFLGRLSEEKGLDVFIDAAKSNPDIPHTIIGDGPLYNYLEKRIEKEHIDNVTMCGHLEGKALVSAMNNARIVVVPSLWYEVAGLSILETHAMGKIVIGSNIGAIPESLDSRFLCKPGDAQDLANKIKQWYLTPYLERQNTGKQSREMVVKKHDTHLYINSILKVYEEVV